MYSLAKAFASVAEYPGVLVEAVMFRTLAFGAASTVTSFCSSSALVVLPPSCLRTASATSGEWAISTWVSASRCGSELDEEPTCSAASESVELWKATCAVAL
jgi:hypothetical protein